MCLRTHRYLTDHQSTGSGAYLCPGVPPLCPGGETYHLESEDDLGGKAVHDALEYALLRFRKDVHGELTIWLVRDTPEGPEASEIPPERTQDLRGNPVIYLTGGSVDQLAFQASHEVFHAVFTPVTTHHWTHEVAAVLFSLEHLRQTGRLAYRTNEIARAKANAARLDLAEFTRVAEVPYPPGFYDRAIMFGLQLNAIVGPGGYLGIATRTRPDGRPDYWGWVDGLPTKLRKAVAAISPPRDVSDSQGAD